MIKLILAMLAGAVLVKQSPVVSGWVDVITAKVMVWFPNFFV